MNKTSTSYIVPEVTRDILYPAYLKTIRKHASLLGKAEQIKARRQWILAETANAEWLENGGWYQQNDLNQDDFNALTSQAINQALGWTLITETGATLKVWREVVAQFANVPNLNTFKDLPFEYFRKARTLYNMSEHGETIRAITAPIIPVMEAVTLQLDANEMYAMYVDPAKAIEALRPVSSWTPERKAAFAVALEEFRLEWFS